MLIPYCVMRWIKYQLVNGCNLHMKQRHWQLLLCQLLEHEGWIWLPTHSVGDNTRRYRWFYHELIWRVARFHDNM